MFYWFTLFNYYTFTVGTFKVFNFKKKTNILYMYVHMCIFYTYFFPCLCSFVYFMDLDLDGN